MTAKYTPNSLSFKDGRGTRIVRTQTLGGGASEIVVSDNVETHFGEVKFQMRNDPDNIQRILAWRDAPKGGLTVSLENKTGTFSLHYSDMTVTNDVEYELQAEGNVEIVFQGSIPT